MRARKELHLLDTQNTRSLKTILEVDSIIERMQRIVSE